MQYRPAEPSDIADVAEMATIAGGGLFEYCLGGATFSETSQAIGLLIGALDEGFSIANAIVCTDDDGTFAGTMIGYHSSEFATAETFASFVQPELFEPVKPIFSLPSDPRYYVHSLAIRPEFTRRGIASEFLKLSEDLARQMSLDKVSLHVWADNHPAVAMYNREGFITEQIVPVDTQGKLKHFGGMMLVTHDLSLADD